MRLTRLGLFAHVLGIRPWEVGRLTVDEFLGLCDFVDEYKRSAEEA